MTQIPDPRLAKEVENLRAEAQHLRRHLRLLSDLSRRIAASVLEPESILQQVVDAACELTSARYGALALFEGGGDNHGLYVHGISDEERARVGEQPKGLGVLGLVREAERPLRLADLTRHPRSVGFPPGHPPMKSFLGVPIRNGGEVAGALYLADKTTELEFTPEDEELLVLFRDQAAAAIRNARLFQREREARSQAEGAQEALSESETRLQAILDNTTAVVFVKDLEGRYVFTNRRYEALRGAGRGEMIGKTVYEIYSPEIADAIWAHDQEVVETRSPHEWEEQFRHPDGTSTTYLSLRFPLWDSAGLLYGVCGILTDISERKRQEEARLEELQGLRALVETSPVGVFTVEAATGTVRMVNREAERILGFPQHSELSLDQYEQAFVRRRPDGRAYRPEELAFRRALATGEVVQGEEMWLEFPDGRRILGRVNVSPVYDDNGRITAAVAAIQDMGGLATLLDDMTGEATATQPALARTDGALMEAGSASERGAAREVNEDSVYCEPPGSGRAQNRGWIFAVADGMGGEAVGELASRTAAGALVDAYYRSSGGPPGLASAASEANQAVRALAASKLQYAGMGTTLTAALINGARLTVAHVGDSRAYLVRNGRTDQVTQDHSWVAELVRAGALTKDQGRTHRYRNVLTRALGRQDQVQVDLIERDLEDGDILVLCSDGVTGKVEDAEIARMVAAQPPQRAASSLVSLARTRGGEDDESAIVVQWQRAPTARAGSE